MNTVPAAFAASVAAHRERIAVRSEDGRELSYAALDAQRIDATRALLACGIQRGDRVAIWAPNGIEWIVAGLAIHSLGAVLVPVNTRMKGSEAGYVLARSGARLLFCAGQFLGTHFPTLLGPHRPATLEQLVVIGAAQNGDPGWLQFLQRAEAVQASLVDEHASAVRPEDRMDILFTSGTTGAPKGVVSCHGQNLCVIAEWSARMQLVPGDQYLVAMPFFHSFGYKVGWLGGLMAGCTILPQAVFDASTVMQRIAREKVSVLPGPPTIFVGLLDDPARASTDLSSLRATITGAAAVAPALIERIRRELGFKIVLTGYGLTETCGVASLAQASDSAQTIASTCGQPIPNTEVRCVDEHGNTLAAGVAGEVLIRGYNVMLGYLDDEAATREAIDTDGWLHTGDVGVLDERGYLRITDRLKDMYIAGGFNCYPAEIEKLIAAHPAVAQVAVIGVPDKRLGEVGKACLVLRPDQLIDEREFIAWCREQMANYKVPRYVEVLKALPTNASGKVLKFELRRSAE
ncbi:MAG: fatty acid--CoA ligase [Hydrocarboniphaga sp.]|uniref:FadD3 family acyl-CoA ligase n=1 Tax=Hydrocarboniphaga sp. TaxID=2033016 RepID=UPI00263686EF|nr:FadD3 family acyl-CoA ligase [Hydrocarboniphaga sp.]MDB5972777.1 fatty acid--CoA ligase [Hydrocarboniphaga sp.]